MNVTNSDPTAPATRGERATLVLLVIVGLVTTSEQFMVVGLLPTIAAEFALSPVATSWILTSTLLSAAVTTPLVGRWADQRDRRRAVVVAATIAGGVGSFIVAVAPSFPVLLLGRVLQGVSGAVVPSALAVIPRQIGPALRARAIAYVATTAGAGSGVGLLLAGGLGPWIGYRAMFAVTGVVLAVLSLLVRLCLNPDPAHRVTESPPPRLDFVGAAAFATFIVSLLLGITSAAETGMTSPQTWGCLGAVVVFGELWRRSTRRVPEPLIRLDLISRPGLMLAYGASSAIGLSLFAFLILVPHATSTLDPIIGILLMMPAALGGLLVAPVAARLIGSVGPRRTTLVAAALSIAAFGTIAATGAGIVGLAIASTLLGLGLGFLLASVSALVYSSVEQGALGIANAVTTLFRTVGSSLGSAATAALLALSPVLAPSAMAATVLVLLILLAWVDGRRVACANGMGRD